MMVKLKNGEEMLIREAAPEDAEDILIYMNIVGVESDNLSFGAEGFLMSLEAEREYIANVLQDKVSCLLLGTVNGRIVTNVSLSGMERKRFAHRGMIAVSVLKEYWNQGIGAIMVEELKIRAKAAGLEQLELEVKTDNVHAIQLYQEKGFQIKGTYPNFFKIEGENYDAHMMVCFL